MPELGNVNQLLSAIIAIIIIITVFHLMMINNNKKIDIYSKSSGSNIIIQFKNLPVQKGFLAFWAASKVNPNIIYSNPWAAYRKSMNSGIRPIVGGKSFIDINCPSSYAIPQKNVVLPKHVHYAIYDITGNPITSVNSISLANYCQ